MKSLMFALVVALLLVTTPVIASPPADGGQPNVGCPSQWAVNDGFPTGIYPVGFPHSDGLNFCLNGSWINREKFFEKTGLMPEDYYNEGVILIPQAESPVASGDASLMAESSEASAESAAAPVQTQSEREASFMAGFWVALFIFIFLIIMSQVLFNRGGNGR